jgi:hypothetical protein
MDIRQAHERLYPSNATILLTHQIDAAYWHEWQLFGLPGGIQLFLLLNLPIVLLVLCGVRSIASGHRSGIVISWLLVVSGLFAVGFHGFHLLRGDEGFSLPVSLGLLAATLLLSLAQAGSLVALKKN